MKKQLMLMALIFFGTCSVKAETELDLLMKTYLNNKTLCAALGEKFKTVAQEREKPWISADERKKLELDEFILGHLILNNCTPFFEAIQQAENEIITLNSCTKRHAPEYCATAYEEEIRKINEVVKPIIQ